MKFHVVTLLTLGCAVAAQPVRNDAARSDLKKLEGTWKVVLVEADGKKMPGEQYRDMRMVVHANRYTVRRGDRVLERGTFTVDPSHKPKAIDVTPTEGKDKGKTFRGIYAIEGDTARDCFSRTGKERPREFTAKAGSGCVLRHYKRVKE
jgi:uncharacterized protein (TIGR03067 family)